MIINSEQHENCSSRETILRSIQVKEILLYHYTSVLFLYILKISANYWILRLRKQRCILKNLIHPVYYILSNKALSNYVDKRDLAHYSPNSSKRNTLLCVEQFLMWHRSICTLKKSSNRKYAPINKQRIEWQKENGIEGYKRCLKQANAQLTRRLTNFKPIPSSVTCRRPLSFVLRSCKI